MALSLKLKNFFNIHEKNKFKITFFTKFTFFFYVMKLVQVKVMYLNTRATFTHVLRYYANYNVYHDIQFFLILTYILQMITHV